MARYSKKEDPSIRFYKTSLKLFTALIILFVMFKFFGPKIGSAFLLLSKHRNEPAQEDIVPPSAPLFSKVPEATNKDKISLNGIAEPGSKIILYVNGPEKATTTSNNEGLFTFIDIELNKGTNTLFAKATDTDNNESKKSNTFSIIYDDEKPEVELINPQDGDTIRNLNRRVLIEGKTNEKADVVINGKYAIVKPDNSFELLLGVEEGNVGIEIKVIDKAGNETIKNITIRYEKS